MIARAIHAAVPDPGLLDHWTTPIVGAVSALGGAIWLLVRMYYQAKEMRRLAAIAQADADAEIAKKRAQTDADIAKLEAEEAKAKLAEAQAEAEAGRLRDSISEVKPATGGEPHDGEKKP